MLRAFIQRTSDNAYGELSGQCAISLIETIKNNARGDNATGWVSPVLIKSVSRNGHVIFSDQTEISHAEVKTSFLIKKKGKRFQITVTGNPYEAWNFIEDFQTNVLKVWFD